MKYEPKGCDGTVDSLSGNNDAVSIPDVTTKYLCYKTFFPSSLMKFDTIFFLLNLQ
jgi:hypothetical protein